MTASTTSGPASWRFLIVASFALVLGLGAAFDIPAWWLGCHGGAALLAWTWDRMPWVRRGSAPAPSLATVDRDTDASCPHCGRRLRARYQVSRGQVVLLCGCAGYRSGDDPGDGSSPPWPVVAAEVSHAGH